MLKEYQKFICMQYINKTQYHVPCAECPLVIDESSQMCMANSHFDEKKKQWVFDDEDRQSAG